MVKVKGGKLMVSLLHGKDERDGEVDGVASVIDKNYTRERETDQR